MKLLAEKLEKYSLDIKSLKEEIVRLNTIYNQCFDRDIRREMTEKQISLTRIKIKLKRLLRENLEELKLIKKHFPDFFNELKHDNYLSSSILSILWVLDFKQLKEDDARKKLEEVKSKRKQLRKIKKEVLSFLNVDYNSLKKFNLLDKILDKKPERKELLEWIEKKDALLKQEGWLILLNEPFITNYLKNYLFEYRMIVDQEKRMTVDYNYSSNMGTLSESEMDKSIREIRKNKNRIYRKCAHMLYSNTTYLKKLKSSKRFNESFDTFDFAFFDSIPLNHIKEESWVYEMSALLS
ncbi:MAG: hypothetical protein PHU63_02905 [Candidatus ainarchaeum sp.]|nr:hypothetical protein [Candidatus ainarchaeum sp.]